MDVKWDPQKAEANLEKHGIDFADAVIVLEDPSARTITDWEEGEERFVTRGFDAQARLLVVVYTTREEQIRIISARKATKRERRQHERD